MKNWKIETTDKETGVKKLLFISAENETTAIKQAQSHGLLVHGVYQCAPGMKSWKIECTNEYTGCETINFFLAVNEKHAVKQALSEGLLVGAVTEYIADSIEKTIIELHKPVATSIGPTAISGNTTEHHSAINQGAGFQLLRMTGSILIFIGIVSALYISFFMETTVAVDIPEEVASYLKTDKSSNPRIYHQKLLNDRLLFGILSGFVFVSGVFITSIATLGDNLRERR